MKTQQIEAAEKQANGKGTTKPKRQKRSKGSSSSAKIVQTIISKLDSLNVESLQTISTSIRTRLSNTSFTALTEVKAAYSEEYLNHPERVVKPPSVKAVTNKKLIKSLMDEVCTRGRVLPIINKAFKAKNEEVTAWIEARQGKNGFNMNQFNWLMVKGSGSKGKQFARFTFILNEWKTLPKTSDKRKRIIVDWENSAIMVQDALYVIESVACLTEKTFLEKKNKFESNS